MLFLVVGSLGKKLPSSSSITCVVYQHCSTGIFHTQNVLKKEDRSKMPLGYFAGVKEVPSWTSALQ